MNVLSALFQRPLIGLDIGVSGIKAVELTSGGARRLVAYNRVPLPPDTISPEGDMKDRATVVTALKRLFDFRGFSAKRVAVGAYGNSIMTKKISVQKMSQSELSEQLYWEAEQYIPFNVNDVNLDFAILGPSTGTQSSATPMIDVLLVAAKKDYIESLTSVVEEAGLIPEVIDNQSFALGNAFEFNYGHLIDASPGGTTNVMIDFGAGSTKVSVVEGDKTTFTRELRQCGLACTLMISEKLNLSFEKAERAKILEGHSGANRNVITEFNGMLVEEISRTLEFWTSQSSEKAIQGIYVCGGGARTYGLMDELEARMPAPVQFLNPVQNIAGSGKKMNAQAIRELSYLGAVAIGLALRRAGDSG